ncbi:hypothetical protein DM860_001091 [Cuscuta australis]|uniref:Uncharacterized protein n=1 Tax=Cuscuta australis TaxID=267555 RepID=A0A328DX65_9ASTE|nr:hypothetical protein DM860_001091 [Cuscuta australis]
MGHRISPFSLHSPHLTLLFPSSPNTLQLPLHPLHSKNRTPPQPRQPPPTALGIPSSKFPNVPSSSSLEISSAPPISIPFTKTKGTLTSFVPISALTSSLNPECIDTSRSYTRTSCDRRTDRAALQSSNVFLMPLSVVV